MVGSAFEGCFLPEKPDHEQESAVEFDFLVKLPLPMAEESTKGILKYVLPSGKPDQVVLDISDLSTISSANSGLEVTAPSAMDSVLMHGKHGFLTTNFVEAMEEKIKNDLSNFLDQKPGGMEMLSRKDVKYCVGVQPSLKISFFKSVTEHLDMSTLDSDTWSGHATENALMLFVNLTNWGSTCWPTRIFNIYLTIQCEWPEEARINWLQRERFWPSETVVKTVAMSSCFLLPVWENSRKGDQIDKEVMEFQMNFGVAEYVLFSETGPKERQCVVILKCIKESYFFSSQIISSYTIKTVVFWYLQSTSLPKRQSLGRGELLERLLDDLIGFLSESCLPHFFIPSVNLIENFDESHIKATVKQLKRVKNNLLNILHLELIQDKCSAGHNDQDFVNKVMCFL